MNWVVISKERAGGNFYPIHVIANDLQAVRFNYKQAGGQPTSYWHDKHVVFHVVWKGDFINQWKDILHPIASSSKMTWIEFDADVHMNNIHTLDNRRGGKKAPLFLYRGLRRATKYFIWELPMWFNPFFGDVVRLPLKLYQIKREEPIRNRKVRDIDFLGFIDTANKNIVPTLQLLERLHIAGYNTRCIVIPKSVYSTYRRSVKYPLVKNTKFTDGGEVNFHQLLDKTKVFLDLSNRITTGRVIYESLFHGALAVGPNTYGATELLFPDLMVDTFQLDMPTIYDKCIYTVNKWSVTEIKRRRAQAKKNAWAGTFKQELIEASR